MVIIYTSFLLISVLKSEIIKKALCKKTQKCGDFGMIFDKNVKDTEFFMLFPLDNPIEK